MAIEPKRAFEHPGDRYSGYFRPSSLSLQFRDAVDPNFLYAMNTRTFLPVFAGPRPGAARGMPTGYGYEQELDPELQVMRNRPIPRNSLPSSLDPEREPYGFLAPRNSGMFVTVRNQQPEPVSYPVPMWYPGGLLQMLRSVFS